jgi:hypothetical protein
MISEGESQIIRGRENYDYLTELDDPDVFEGKQMTYTLTEE